MTPPHGYGFNTHSDFLFLIKPIQWFEKAFIRLCVDYPNSTDSTHTYVQYITGDNLQGMSEQSSSPRKLIKLCQRNKTISEALNAPSSAIGLLYYAIGRRLEPSYSLGHGRDRKKKT